jgi:hypothetical protein
MSTKPNDKIILNSYLKTKFISPDSESYFFGYYNYSALSLDGSKLLAHRVNFEGRMPEYNDSVEIGYFDLEKNEWISITKSRAFNWQQGAMLQWLGPDFNTKFIFNDVDENKFISRIYNINKKSFKIIPKAIYSIDPKGEYSISLNFERSHWVRAYSYASIKNEFWDKPIPEKDGIIKINLKTGESETIISLKDIVSKSTGLNTSGDHWVEHIMLNPSGNRFGFYHRYGSNNQFNTNFITADISGNNIWLHPNNESNEYTHMGWQNNNSFVVFTKSETQSQKYYQQIQNNKTFIKNLVSIYRKQLKKFIPKKIKTSILKQNNYYSFSIDQQEEFNKIDPKIISQDGHPSFSKDGRYMLTDTYEDKNSYRNLLLYDTLMERKILLGKFYSHYNSCGWRADLHPRFSFDDSFVVIDSTHNGYHQLIVLKIDWKQITKL